MKIKYWKGTATCQKCGWKTKWGWDAIPPEWKCPKCGGKLVVKKTEFKLVPADEKFV